MNYKIPDEIQNILQIAVESKLYSVAEIYLLALKHQYEWRCMVSSICMTAYQHRNTHYEAWKDILKLSEYFWKAEREWI